MKSVVYKHRGLVRRKDITVWGFMKHRLKEFPTPDRLRLREAIRRTRQSYREVVAFYNPYHNDRAMQWLDYAVFSKRLRRMVVIEFDWDGRKRTRAAYENKRRFLEERGVHVLTVPRDRSTNEYQALIERWLMRLATEAAAGRAGHRRP